MATAGQQTWLRLTHMWEVDVKDTLPKGLITWHFPRNPKEDENE